MGVGKSANDIQFTKRMHFRAKSPYFSRISDHIGRPLPDFTATSGAFRKRTTPAHAVQSTKHETQTEGGSMPADPVAAGRKGGKSKSAKKLAAAKRNGFQKKAKAKSDEQTSTQS
jgi:hypothetical protein